MHPCLKNGTRACEYVYMRATRTHARVHTQIHTGASSPSMPTTPDAALIAKKQRRLVKNRSCTSVCALSKYEICSWGAGDGKVQGQIDDKETASDTANGAGLCVRGAKACAGSSDVCVICNRCGCLKSLNCRLNVCPRPDPVHTHKQGVGAAVAAAEEEPSRNVGRAGSGAGGGKGRVVSAHAAADRGERTLACARALCGAQLARGRVCHRTRRAQWLHRPGRRRHGLGALRASWHPRGQQQQMQQQ